MTVSKEVSVNLLTSGAYVVDPLVKYLYLRDPWCTDRVLTVGRKIINGELYITWALNKVVLDKVAHERNRYMPKYIVLDRFDKKRARHIVCARMALKKHRLHVVKLAGEKNIQAAIRTLMENQDKRAESVRELVVRAVYPGKNPNPYPQPVHPRKLSMRSAGLPALEAMSLVPQ